MFSLIGIFFAIVWLFFRLNGCVNYDR